MILKNKSNVEYSYILPDTTTETDTSISNEAVTEVLTDEILKIKSSEKLYLKSGESIKQKVVVTNNSAAKLENQFFKDVMSGPAEYQIGSVVINGTNHPEHDLVNGFNLPDLNPGQSNTIEYIIKGLPNDKSEKVINTGNLGYTIGGCDFNENTNTVLIETVNASLGITKVVDKAYAIKGDTLHYTNTISNTGNVDKTNVVFRDIIPVGTSFVLGSVKINGVVNSSLNPVTGFNLDNISVGGQIVVEFDVLVE